MFAVQMQVTLVNFSRISKIFRDFSRLVYRIQELIFAEVHS
jgi:hypothetical protein